MRLSRTLLHTAVLGSTLALAAGASSAGAYQFQPEQKRILAARGMRAAAPQAAATLSAHAADTFTVLHNFGGSPNDGANSGAEVSIDKSGNIWGTTDFGGSNTDGTIFKIAGGTESTLQIESVMLPGKGRMQTTGKLGDVMKESIDAARSYVRSKAPNFGIKPPTFEQKDIHVHVPEGATPKDGPSAGVAMAVSIISVLTGIPVRRDVAMTGEITLRGRVLPIGGLKEKLLAALRSGLATVIIPAENEKDLAEIPDNVKSGLRIVPVSNVEEVLKIALVRSPEPILWEEPELVAPAASRLEDADAIVTH